MREWIRLLEEIVVRGISDKASGITISDSNIVDLTGDEGDGADSPHVRARQILDNLAQARIRSSLDALGRAHNELLDFSDEIVGLLRESHFEVSSNEQVDLITEIGFRRDTAASLFPKKQKLSFLGYNQLDRHLGGGMVEGKIDTKMHGKRKRTHEERDESGDEASHIPWGAVLFETAVGVCWECALLSPERQSKLGWEKVLYIL